jgi:aminoglycoside phosphotransferase (APT) family kinase protein
MLRNDPPTPVIDVHLVDRLIKAQFPEFSDLPIKPVELSGWDNRTFHLGDEMSVRLPSAASYASQVEKEQHWLPRIAPKLPLPISTPVAIGEPSNDFSWPWSIYKWLPGEVATVSRIDDLGQFASDLAEFLRVLQRLDLDGGPTPGKHSGLRGGPVSVWDKATRQAIADLKTTVSPAVATEIWESALSTAWDASPVWVHGDVAAGNLLVRDGRLSAVIDFGQLVTGDPACDMVIAWTLLDADSREVFRDTLGVDHGTWLRGRGWALWKAMIVQAGHIDTNAIEAEASGRVIAELLADHHPPL